MNNWKDQPSEEGYWWVAGNTEDTKEVVYFDGSLVHAIDVEENQRLPPELWRCWLGPLIEPPLPRS